jgi:hypothetical protein
MKEFLKILPIVLYFIVGAISLVMAYKGQFAKKFLPFHENAVHKPWHEIEKPFQHLILLFLRLTGLGFFIMAILLLVCPIVNYFKPGTFYQYFIPGIALIYCLGLYINNYLLYRNTKADTPWKGSLYAVFIIIAGIIISIFN